MPKLTKVKSGPDGVEAEGVFTEAEAELVHQGQVTGMSVQTLPEVPVIQGLPEELQPAAPLALPQAAPGAGAVLKAPIRPEDRRPFDDYPTEPGWTHALLDRVQFEGTTLEPAAGAGWMVQALQDRGLDVRYSDLERDGADFLAYDGPQVENVVTNPPYRLVDEFAHKAREVATHKVALLLADYSLSGINRTKGLWQAWPPAKIIWVPSKMKVLGKVSMFPHVWVVWDTAHHGPTEFEWALIPKDARIDTSKATPNLRSQK